MTTAEWIKRRIEGLNPKNDARVTPDPGDTKNVEANSKIDKLQKSVENIDGTIANTGALGNLASLSKIPYLSTTGRLLTGAASKFEPIMLGLTAVDAGRALFEEDYRKAALNSIENLAVNPKKGVFGGALDSPYFNTTIFSQAFERPVSTAAALTRALMQARERMEKAKETEKEVALKLKILEIEKEKKQRKAKEKKPESQGLSKYQ